MRSTDPNDPNIVATTIIDGEHIPGHRGFSLGLEGEANSVIDGLTVVGFLIDSSGGGIACASGVTIRNCNIRGNFAAVHGGGVGGQDFRLVNCAVTGNSASSGGGVAGGRITGCLISGNTADHLGGGLGGVLSVSKSRIIDNFAGHAGGGISNVPAFGNGFVEDSIISGNTAEYDGGGLHACLVPVRRCLITGNTAGRDGGGVRTCLDLFDNCIVSGNSAGRHGGGVSDCNGPIVNCTITGNSAATGGAIHCYETNAAVTNCILSDNLAEIGSQIAITSTHSDRPCTLSLNYSDLRGGRYNVFVGNWSTFNSGPGNIDADPCFVEPGHWDANDVWVEGDYHLLETSPCVDAGDPNYSPQPNETDLDGNPRVTGCAVDMGAYEYPLPLVAQIHIQPRTINLRSQGKWLTCRISLPDGYNAADIDIILLADEIEPASFRINSGAPGAVAFFSRRDLQDILDPGRVELTITGQLNDGTKFMGIDTIKVINNPPPKPARRRKRNVNLKQLLRINIANG